MVHVLPDGSWEIVYNYSGKLTDTVAKLTPRLLFATKREAVDVARRMNSSISVREEFVQEPASAPPAPPAPLPSNLAGEDVLQEPLLGLAEADMPVGRCGPCAQGAGAPQVIRVERAKRSAEGFSFESVREVEIPKALVQAYEAPTSTCLPWVKISRDPKRFRDCMGRASKLGAVTSSDVFYDLIKGSMMQEDQEVFYVLMLDTQMNIRGISELARGARDRVGVPVPDVLRLVLVEGATGYCVAHNHPSGKPFPSEADKHLTKALAEASDAVDVKLIDHIIVGNGCYYSFADGKVKKRK